MPKAAGAVPRTRLFHLLDRFRKRSPALWLSSPGGSGKTVLVSGYVQDRRLPCLWYQMDGGDADLSGFFYYLGQAVVRAAPKRKPLPLFTAEYQQSARLFARRFFEELAAGLKHPAIMVFDNCETVDGKPDLLEALAEGVCSLPESVSAVFISRHDLPKEFSGLKLSGRIESIGWEEMKLSPAETGEIAGLRGWTRTEARQLHEQAGGWMAALIVMLEQARTSGDMIESAPATRTALFDFFSHEIYGRMPEETRMLLLKTAFLRALSPEAGERLSRSAHAGRILALLSRKNYFTERLSGSAPVYQYHPLFREFLAEQCRETFSPDQIKEIKQESAAVLAEKGDPDVAVRLLMEAEKPAEALELLLGNAFSFISQGRNRTFLELLALLPEGLVAATPWCGFWRGLATQPFDPAQAREYFSGAFHGFKSAGDLAGMLRCWSSLVETLFHAWNDCTLFDPWLAWLDEVSREGLVISDPVLDLQVSSAMSAALTMRGGDPAKMRYWAERAIRALEPVNEPYPKLSALVYCVNYVSWVRQLDLDSGIMEISLREAEKADLPPILKLTAVYVRSALAIRRDPDMRKVLEDVRSALSLAEETGVHVWDEIFYGLGVYCAVVLNEKAASALFVDKMQACVSIERKQGMAFCHYVRAWDRLTFGPAAEASEAIAQGLHLYGQTGYEFPSNVATYAAAVIFAENNEPDKALEHAVAADAIAEKFEALSMRYTTLLVLAYVRLKRGERPEAIKALGEALRIARAGKFLRLIWWWHGPMMSGLMALAIHENIEREYAIELVRRLKLLPADPATAPEAWPWQIKVDVLGRFQVTVEDKPVDTGKRSQQKPLALLRLLAFFGPEGIATSRLADLLWPEAEGDKAQHALEMALSRLRKLLQRDDAVEVRAGTVRLNRSLCWVDARAFGEIADAGLDHLKNGKTDDGKRLLEQALPLYRGHLADSDGQDHWALSARERLRMKYLLAIEALADAYEQSGDSAKALDLFRKGIEVDELSEELCRRYMRCCLQLGRRSEALSAYQRLDRALKNIMGIAPSAETRKMIEANENRSQKME